MRKFFKILDLSIEKTLSKKREKYSNNKRPVFYLISFSSWFPDLKHKKYDKKKKFSLLNNQKIQNKKFGYQCAY